MDTVGEDGYELWLRYRKVENPGRLTQYREAIQSVTVLGRGATSDTIRRELARALPALLDSAVPLSDQVPAANALVVGTAEELDAVGVALPEADRRKAGEEGFLIRSHRTASGTWTLIAGNSGPAVLVGMFHFLRLLQTHQDIGSLDLSICPRIRHRVLGHWDNLDGSIERGYSGRSLWNWDELPEITQTRYHDYARACASIGINDTVLNNVNAQAESLRTEYLQKTAALADLLRPYGIRVYLAPRFSAPVQLGGLATNGLPRRWIFATVSN
jgi:alpha-glucuronidase